jgi:hypothetical protein
LLPRNIIPAVTTTNTHSKQDVLFKYPESWGTVHCEPQIDLSAYISAERVDTRRGNLETGRNSQSRFMSMIVMNPNHTRDVL